MGIGDDTDTAAARLLEIHEYYREYPVTGPTVRSTPSATPGTPLNLATLDYVTATVQEVVQHTRAANPDAGPLPARVEAVYDWCREHTQHTDQATAQRLETLEYRHRLEHALRAGDDKVVRPHRCPACGTVGLHWQQADQRARCLNRHCARRNGGVSRSWSLARLAYEYVASKKHLKDCAT